jgi:hypothetical protein
MLSSRQHCSPIDSPRGRWVVGTCPLFIEQTCSIKWIKSQFREHPELERSDKHVPPKSPSLLSLTVRATQTIHDRTPLSRVILALDSANAFNALSQAQLTAVLQEDCAHFVECPADPNPMPNQPEPFGTYCGSTSRHITAAKVT